MATRHTKRFQKDVPPEVLTCSSFEECESLIAALPDERERGRVFERFVYAFLRWSQELELTSVWPLKAAPRAALEALGIRRNDIGIDLIAQRSDKTTWAIQAKFRSDRRPVPWRELSTFIGASQKADHRLLVGNQRRLPRNFPESIPRFGSALLDALLRLRSDFFQAWAAIERDERPEPPKRLAPRPDQNEAVSRVVQSLASRTSRSQLVAACGTGKTMTALWVAEKLGSRRTIVFAPSLALVHQTLREWSNQTDGKYQLEALCVCSDATVGDVHPHDLPVPVTTNANDVCSFWRRRLKKGRRRVVFATYRSVAAVGVATSGHPAELLIADEAHRIAGPSGKAFQAVLDDNRVASHRRLFMTATPRISAPQYKRREERAGRPLVSMDDSKRFGEVAYSLTFGDAIDIGLLSDYQIDVLGVTNQEIAEFVRDRKIVDGGLGVLDAETLAQALALRNALQDKLFKYAFSFHHSRRNARTFNTALKQTCQSGDLFAKCVFGDMSVAERVAVLHDLFRSKRGVLCTARALNEGVDAPAVDAVVFVDPKSSVIDIVQAVGRALRRDKQNPSKVAHIIVPVAVTSSDDPERELGLSAWDAVWRVLVAMQSHDSRLADEIAHAVLERGRRRVRRRDGRGMRLSKLNVQLPPAVSLDQFADAVTFAALDAVGGFLPFEEAREYVQSLRLPDVRAYEAWRANRPADIPAAPNIIYRHNGWVDWGDFLGTGRIGNIGRKWRSFEEAREYVRAKGFSSVQEYWRWSKSGNKPKDIPQKPNRTYENDGWKSYGDFLGTDEREKVGHRVKWRSFAEARKHVRSLGFRTTREYYEWVSSDDRPSDIPYTPEKAYRDDGWTDWSDFLGTRVRRHGKWRPFLEAREFVRALNLSGTTAWNKWCATDKRPADIPTDPARVYETEGWNGMADWLGTDNVASHLIQWLPFEEARSYVHSLKIGGQKEWHEAVRAGLIPTDIPNRPDHVYKSKGWAGYKNWLGTEFWSFKEARAFARTLGLETSRQWRGWRKNRPSQMPSSPDEFYSSQWRGWPDFLQGSESEPGEHATPTVR